MEKLVNESKEAVKNGDLETASKLMNYFANSMNNFTDNEVYEITEYIKSKEN